MIITSLILEDVRTHAQRNYHEGKSLFRWKLAMVLKYGLRITPYLDDTWELIQKKGRKSIVHEELKPVASKSPSDEAAVTLEKSSSKAIYHMVGPGRFAQVSDKFISVKSLFQLWNTILAIATVAFIVAGLFPPWLYTFDTSGVHSRKNAGYSFISQPPATDFESANKELKRIGIQPYLPEYYGIQIDYIRLSIEWICILVIFGAAWLLFGKARRKV
jgi:hypothetical protein